MHQRHPWRRRRTAAVMGVAERQRQIFSEFIAEAVVFLSRTVSINRISSVAANFFLFS
jgi:hypothetical protein